MPTGTPDYSKACIYKIWSPLTDRIYIGSTCDMTKRWCHHKSDYKKWKEGKCGLITSFLLFDLVGLQNCKMEWVKDFPCETKKQLNKEEGRVMRLNKDLIINMIIAGRSHKEYCDEHIEEVKKYQKEYRDTHIEEFKEYQKEYYEDHKKEKKEYQKEYYENHKELCKEYHKEYHQQHKEELNIKKKEYYENHKEEISIKGSKKITCECGKPYTLNHKARHIKSQKHQDFIKPQ